MAKKRRKKNGVKKFIIITILLSISVLAFITLNAIDNRLVPIIQQLTTTYGKSIINDSINSTIESMVKEKKITPESFYTTNFDNAKDISSVEVNTILVNDLCSKLSNNILASLQKDPNRKLSIPFSTLFSFTFFNNLGPDINISLLPIGNVDANYNTSFAGAGVNQTTFEIWIDVKATIQVINPLEKKEIVIERKVPLVTTIINGKVPSYMTTTPNTSSN